MAKPKQPDSTPDATAYVWVFDDYVAAARPSVTRFVLLKNELEGDAKQCFTAGYVTVAVRGGKKVIKASSGRSFFLTTEALAARLKTWWAVSRENSQKQVDRAGVILDMLNTGSYPESYVNLVPAEGVVTVYPEKLRLTEDDHV